MRTILNFVITFGALFLANYFFPESVYVQDTKTLLIVSVLYAVLLIGLNLLLIISAILIPLGIGCLTFVPLLIVGLFFAPVFLFFTDKYMEGFAINGFWPFVILSVILSLLTLQSSSND